MRHADQDRFRAGNLLPLVVPALGGRLHLFANACAHGGILQALHQLRVTAVVGPGRDKRRKVVEPGWIRVRVRADIDARGARGLDVADDFRHAPPVTFPCRFQVPDLDRQAPFASDADCFIDRAEDGVAFAAHVRGVDAAQFAALTGQRDQLGRLRIGRRRVLQGSGQPHRAVLHGVDDQGLHALEFLHSGIPVHIAQDHAPHLSRAHVAGEVDSDALLLQSREIL